MANEEDDRAVERATLGKVTSVREFLEQEIARLVEARHTATTAGGRMKVDLSIDVVLRRADAEDLGFEVRSAMADAEKRYK